jgi:hypothetical protein
MGTTTTAPVVAGTVTNAQVQEQQANMQATIDSIGGRYQQPPAVGKTRFGTLLAAASNNHGLKVFDIHPDYLAPRQNSALIHREMSPLRQEAIA